MTSAPRASRPDSPGPGTIPALLTDLYQLTMAHAHWVNGRHETPAAFELFFRRPPFQGEFTVFAGLEQVLTFLEGYRIGPADVDFLRQILPSCRDGFFHWLSGLDASAVRLYALPEGCAAFPQVPLLRVEGPLALAQLLETTLLNLINYASLVATNAARFRLAAGPGRGLFEFGLRRAQGPDGGLSASLYAYLGGFDGTSNVLAGQRFGIPLRGTHAHSYVQAYRELAELPAGELVGPDGRGHDIVALALEARRDLDAGRSHEGELAAFLAYARAFPDRFLALVDTYDTLQSGVPNFLCVAAALVRCGYRPVGIRLDSGDLSHLSREARRMFARAADRLGIDLSGLSIVASNDINEGVLLALQAQDHAIDVFGIGTHLVTCQAQPALGGVYKLVEIDGRPRIKLSQDRGKVTIPGRKSVFRLVGRELHPLLDLLTGVGEPAPEPGRQVLCRHPFDETRRVLVTPRAVEPLLRLVWAGRRLAPPVDPATVRSHVQAELGRLRPDHLRAINPTPYKVSLSESLYTFMHRQWQREAPVPEMD